MGRPVLSAPAKADDFPGAERFMAELVELDTRDLYRDGDEALDHYRLALAELAGDQRC
jgi:hypothetical protein